MRPTEKAGSQLYDDLLGLDRIETDAFLKRHNVVDGSLTWADLEQDRQTLKRVTGT